MILYLEASAAVKLYSNEDYRPYVRELSNRVLGAGGEVAISGIGYVEIIAALRAKARSKEMNPLTVNGSLARLRSTLRTGTIKVYGTSGLVLAVAGGIPGDEPAGSTSQPHALQTGLPRDVPPGSPGTVCEHPLRGYDAVHLAHAVLAREDHPGRQVLMLSFDRDLHDAAAVEGVAHENPHPNFDGGDLFNGFYYDFA